MEARIGWEVTAAGCVGMCVSTAGWDGIPVTTPRELVWVRTLVSVLSGTETLWAEAIAAMARDTKAKDCILMLLFVVVWVVKTRKTMD